MRNKTCDLILVISNRTSAYFYSSADLSISSRTTSSRGYPHRCYYSLQLPRVSCTDTFSGSRIVYQSFLLTYSQLPLRIVLKSMHWIQYRCYICKPVRDAGRCLSNQTLRWSKYLQNWWVQRHLKHFPNKQRSWEFKSLLLQWNRNANDIYCRYGMNRSYCNYSGWFHLHISLAIVCFMLALLN